MKILQYILGGGVVMLCDYTEVNTAEMSYRPCHDSFLAAAAEALVAPSAVRTRPVISATCSHCNHLHSSVVNTSSHLCGCAWTRGYRRVSTCIKIYIDTNDLNSHLASVIKKKNTIKRSCKLSISSFLSFLTLMFPNNIILIRDTNWIANAYCREQCRA